MSLKRKKIAIVGVSENPSKYGNRIFSDLIRTGYSIYGTNARGGKVFGREIYKCLDALPSNPDLVVTVVPPVVTSTIVDDCVRLKIKEIWMQPGSQSDQAIKKAENAGIKVVSNACIMVAEGIW